MGMVEYNLGDEDAPKILDEAFDSAAQIVGPLVEQLKGLAETLAEAHKHEVVKPHNGPPHKAQCFTMLTFFCTARMLAAHLAGVYHAIRKEQQDEVKSVIVEQEVIASITEAALLMRDRIIKGMESAEQIAHLHKFLRSGKGPTQEESQKN